MFCSCEAPGNSNILEARFGLAIKDRCIDLENVRARFAVQGEGDKGKSELLQKVSEAIQHNTKMLLRTGAPFRFQLSQAQIVIPNCKILKSIVETIL